MSELTEQAASKGPFFQRWFASGEPWIWMNAAAVGISVTAVVGILLLLAVKGLAHFWPADIALISYESEDGKPRQVYGELIERDVLPVQQFLESGGPAAWVDEDAEEMERWLVKTGNRKVAGPDFRWIFAAQISAIDYPAEVVAIERLEWGNAYGLPVSMQVPDAGASASGLRTVVGEEVVAAIANRLVQTTAIREQIDGLESGVLNRINNDLERLRLERRKIEMAGIDVPRLESIAQREQELRDEYQTSSAQLRAFYAELNQGMLRIETAQAQEIQIKVSDVLHTWQPNPMSVLEKTLLYGLRS